MISVGKINTGGAMSKLMRMGKKAQLAIADGLYVIAIDAQKIAQRSLAKGPKSGRLYGTDRDIKKVNYKLRGHKAALKRVHRASAVGEAPANDHGFLTENIKVVKATTVGYLKTAYVRSNAKYSKALEYGTMQNGGPRPFLNPAARAAFKNVRAVIEKELIKRGAYE